MAETDDYLQVAKERMGLEPDHAAAAALIAQAEEMRKIREIMESSTYDGQLSIAAAVRGHVTSGSP